MNLHATRQNYRLGQLSSAKCQAFYAAPDAVPAAAYDAALGAYRPDPTSARPLRLVSRPFTYEDTRLAGWSAPTSPASDHVLPLWVGTAQRAVKAFFEPAFGRDAPPDDDDLITILGGAQRRPSMFVLTPSRSHFVPEVYAPPRAVPLGRAPTRERPPAGQFLAPAVWKAGSTSLNALLARHTSYCRDRVHAGGGAAPCVAAAAVLERRPSSAHWPRACAAGEGGGGCSRYGTFLHRLGDYPFTFAFVRDPLDRFVATALSALREPINNCTKNWYWGRVCPHTLPLLRRLAADLLAHMPTALWKLPLGDHFLTQSYFLAATDWDGAPLNYDMVGQLETWDDDVAALLLHIAPHANATERAAARAAVRLPGRFRAKAKGGGGGDGDRLNASGSASKKAAVRALIEGDPLVMRAVCKIYAQDWACLGYQRPAICDTLSDST